MNRHFRAHRAVSRVLVLALALFAAACQTVQTTQPGAVGIERKQRMLISQEEVESGAVEAYRQELEKARAKHALNGNKWVYDRVQEISQRLIAQTHVFRPDAPSWDWEVNVQSTKEVNAYCMPGGKIMVYTGLIETLEVTDDELAAVIGHEIAHALREHSRERLSRSLAEDLALTGIALATGAEAGTMELVSKISAVTFTLPHSREQESEADRMGLELMARAGYDPNAAITLWQKMSRLGGSGPEFLSTHPSGESRIRDLEAAIPRVLPLYVAATKESFSSNE